MTNRKPCLQISASRVFMLLSERIEKSFKSNGVVAETEVFEYPDQRIETEEHSINNCYKTSEEG